MSNDLTSEARREQTYVLIANAIDDIDPDQERLFLAKLALLLALKVDNPDALGEIISRCRSDL